MNPWRVVALVGVLAATPTALADAGRCADGLVPVDGYCCWPGQSFDVDRDRCVGAPVCPAGFVGVGSRCAREDVPAPSSAALLSSPASPSERAPVVHHRRVAAYTSGALMFFISYPVGVLTPPLSGAPNAGWSWIPFVHGLGLIGASYGGGGALEAAIATCVIAGATEVAGLVLMIVGEIGVGGPGLPTFVVSVSPSAADADAGLTLHGAF